MTITATVPVDSRPASQPERNRSWIRGFGLLLAALSLARLAQGFPVGRRS